MKQSFTAGVICAALAACGGGGGNDGGTGSPPIALPLPMPQQLAAYIGTWRGECDGDHERDTAVVSRTPGTTDAVSFSIKTDYFAGADCSGPTVATGTETGVITAKYVATVNTAVVLSPGTQSVPVSIDQITVSRSQSLASMTGPGVIHTVKNGQAQWCFDLAAGSTRCVHDMGTIPAEGGISGGLYPKGNEMFLLVPNGSIYTVDAKLVKQ